MIWDLSGKQLRLVVDEIVDRWRGGDPPDASAVLAEYPQLREHHSLAVDLAYEEFCLRQEAGESLDQRRFCQQFSQFQYSLARMLNLHRVLQSQALGLSPKDKEKVEWPQLGSRWLDWTLLEEIGRGAFSRVYLAEEPSLGNRRVVVKCSTSGAGEAFLLGKLAHEHVMPIHSIRHDEPRQLVGICMPYVGRVTLADVLNRLVESSAQQVSTAVFAPQLGNWRAAVPEQSITGPGYLTATVRLIEKVARGLALAHQENVLHGDIKPSNIILAFDGEPLLVDFNLSDDGASNRRLGGTPPYMAPERLSLLTPEGVQEFDRTNTELSLRSDVFSLGIVLCELLYGDTPYDFAIEELTAGYCPRRANLVSDRCVSGEAVPRELQELLLRAIALEPNERVRSARDFADELCRWANERAAPAQVKPRRWVGLSIVTGALACALVLLGWMFFGPGGLPPHPPARSQEYIWLDEAIQHLEQKDYLLANEKLQQLPLSPEIDAWMGYCLAKRSHPEEAKFLFNRALPEADSSGVLLYNIGCCDLKRNRVRNAVENLTKAVECDPYCSQFYQQLAVAKMRMVMQTNGDLPPDALDDMESALSLPNADPYLICDAACVYGYSLRPSDKPLEQDTIDRCRKYTRRALAAGTSPALLAGAFPPDFNFAELSPAAPPEALAKRESAAAFLPPTADLQDVLNRLP